MRKDGYYWVKRDDYGWMVGFYGNKYNSWCLPGAIPEYQDDDFTEIDERRIVMEEPIQYSAVQGTTPRIPQNE